MIISPPFLPESGLVSGDSLGTDPMMDAVDRFERRHGIYRIAFDRRWHCGQLTAEIARPEFMVEGGSPEYFKKYEPEQPEGKNLGNTERGDGPRFKGREL